jgi:hypothetical protein
MLQNIFHEPAKYENPITCISFTRLDFDQSCKHSTAQIYIFIAISLKVGESRSIVCCLWQVRI